MHKQILLMGVMLAALVTNAQAQVSANAKDGTNRKGYAGVTLHLDQPKINIGGTEVRTTRAFEVVSIVYKENPNIFDLPWRRVIVTHSTGTSVVDSLESFSKRNYISMISTDGTTVTWIPFGAIDSVVLEKASERPFSEIRSQKDLLSHIEITLLDDKKYYEGTKLSMKANVVLRSNIFGIGKKISGYLLDSYNSTGLGVYRLGTWGNMKWTDLKSIKIHYDDNKAISIDDYSAYLIYREQHMYADVWREYSMRR